MQRIANRHDRMAGIIEREGIGRDGGGDRQRAGSGGPDHECSLRLAPWRQIDRLGLARAIGVERDLGADRIAGEILSAGEQGDILADDWLSRLRQQAADGEIGRAGGGHAVGAEDDILRELGRKLAPSGGLKIRDDDQLAMTLDGGKLLQCEVECGGESPAFREWLHLLELLS